MKTPTNTQPSLLLPAAFLALAHETVLLDPASRKVISTDGEAIALHPLPEGFTKARTISREWPGSISPNDGGDASDTYDLTALRTEGAYVVALNPQKLVALAAALGAEDLVIIEFPAHPAEGPMFVRPANGESYGYLMPQPMPGNGHEGLVGIPTTDGNRLNSDSKQPAAESKPLPPPVVTASIERKTLEIAFGGKPADEIREALKDPGLGFRYSGRGTKRGIPPAMWYGPDNPYTRERIAALLKVEITEAKAA